MKSPLAAALLILAVPAAHGATFTVTNSNNSGAGSLRRAIEDANLTVAADTINFDTAGHFSVQRTITLTSGELLIDKALTIDAPAQANRRVTVSGNDASRVMRLTAAVPTAITLRNLTLRDGNAIGVGGGIWVATSHVTATVENCTITSCDADDDGGGIDVSGGALTVIGSTISDNRAMGQYGSGGGVSCFLGAAVTLKTSTISGNFAQRDGGAMWISDASLAVVDCAILDNHAEIFGGGFYFTGHEVVATITNSTISGNSSGNGVSGEGGALIAVLDASVTLTNCTITDNEASSFGGGAHAYSSSNLFFGNCVIAGNRAPTGPDLGTRNGYVIESNGFNLLGIDVDGPDDFNNGSEGDMVGTLASPLDPMLGPMQNNGGSTMTHALLQGSPAIDAGNSARVTDPPFTGPTFTDQRGLTRIVGNTVDIGAYEVPVLEVLNTADSGAGSLRDIVALANAGGGVVSFKRSVFNATQQVILLTSGQIPINNAVNVDIIAPEVGLKINAGGNSRIFNVTGGAIVTLEGIEFINGSSTADGGAIRANGVTTDVTLRKCKISDCVAVSGGALSIESGAAVRGMDCAFFENSATAGSGGGIRMNGANSELYLTNSTLGQNNCTEHGGGIYHENGIATLINCTLSQNSADSNANNLGEGGGIRREAGTISLGNSLVAGNSDLSPIAVKHHDLSDTFTSLGHNLIGISNGSTGFVNGSNGDLAGTLASPLNASLAALSGGHYVPNPGSPALNAGDNALLNHATWLATPEFDPRGQFRTVNGTVDIGAVEGPVGSVVRISITDQQGSEQQADPAKIRFLRSLATGTSLAISGNIDVASSASATDYALSGPSYQPSGPSGFLMAFPLNDDSITLTVTPTNDSNVEGSETVSVSLTGIGFALDTGEPASRVVEILDNEFTVTSSASSGTGSLREAVNAANAFGGGKITIAAPLCITLGGTPLTIEGDTEIIGNVSTVSGGGVSRVFDITGDGGGCVKLQGLVITGGYGAGGGGGIQITDSCVEMRGCAVENNVTPSSGSGGGIFVAETSSSLTVINSSISDNSASRGGGVFCEGSLTMTNVTVARNFARIDGGGLRLGSLDHALTNCTIAENTVEGGSSVDGDGGGIYLIHGDLTLNNSVVTANVDLPGNSNSGSPKPNFYTSGTSSIITGGGNFVGSNAGAEAMLPQGNPNGNGDYIGTANAPLYESLRPHKDVRVFYIFPPSSRLQNHGINATNLEPSDQRGRSRIAGGTIDIGAVEMNSFLVSTVNGGNTAGSLRRAINDANAAGGGDIVFEEVTAFPAHQSISLDGSGQLNLTTPISIFGPAARVTVNASVGRVMRLAPAAPASIFLSNLIFANGNADTTYGAGLRDGGGLWVGGNAAASLHSMVIRDCLAAEDGGGMNIEPGGSVQARDYSSYQCDAAGVGGGIANRGTLLLERAAVYRNYASANDGGGLFNGANATLLNVTIEGNFALDDGGGIFCDIATGEVMELRNCTIATNRSSDTGGGIFRQGLLGTASLKNCQINTNIADPATGPDLFGLVVTRGHNLVTKNTSVGVLFPVGSPNANADYVGTGAAPLSAPLGALQNNGGLNWTMMPLCGNPGIDTGTSDGAPATDQRGLPRIFGAAPDIGAYELQPETYDFWSSHTISPVDTPQRDDLADYDGDGAINGLEYLAGTDPINARFLPDNATPPIQVTWNGATFSVRYNISLLADPARYRVRMSTDMQTWFLVPTTITDEGCQGLTKQFRFSRSFPNTTKKAFARLEYLQP